MPPVSSSLSSSSPSTRELSGCSDCFSGFSVAWSCLVVIGLCTYVSFHPNVPRPNLSFWQKIWRRVQLTIVALIAPELIFAFAVRQYFVARWFVKTRCSPNEKVSMTHGFFLAMGGFITPSNHPVVGDPERLNKYIKGIQDVAENEIKDKSKKDYLAKILTLLSVLDFLANLVQRTINQAPVSPLENITLGFIFIYVLTLCFWWHKPQDVDLPIRIQPVFQSARLTDTETGEEASTVSPPRSWKIFSAADLNGAVFGNYPDFKPQEFQAVPEFWSVPAGGGPKPLPLVFALEIIAATAFGAIHCAAWTTTLPSQIELQIWRTSALFITCFPILCAVLLKASGPYRSDVASSLRRKVLVYINYGLLALYIVARFSLLIVSFTSLRTSLATDLKCCRTN
ncbi:hypothetical protein R3P38DRAFT_3394389 [Favolaschia claudopus]|uniref:Uncharacterized protein n=1 Tax=Favolaschia claudopus TaxID=2862362 RepID=A0AAW0BTM9_9AGAR